MFGAVVADKHHSTEPSIPSWRKELTMATIKMSELRQQAKAMELKIPFKITKAELIQTIQRAEGNFPCFGTASDNCDQTACRWRVDCLKQEV